MQVRLAKIEEVAELELLIAESVRRLSADYYSSQQIESALLHVFGIDTQLIVDGTYFVAEIDDKIVGCGGWSKRKTLFGGDQAKLNEDNLLDPKTEPARIRAFFIHPDFARRGIGTMIINQCENAAKMEGFSHLELGATLSGVPLYEASGYHVIEEFTHQLKDGVDFPLVRMGKEILQREAVQYRER